MKQYQKAEILGVDKTTLNKILKGKRPVSWPLAEKLAQVCPDKDVAGWKYASPNELESAVLKMANCNDSEAA